MRHLALWNIIAVCMSCSAQRPTPSAPGGPAPTSAETTPVEPTPAEPTPTEPALSLEWRGYVLYSGDNCIAYATETRDNPLRWRIDLCGDHEAMVTLEGEAKVTLGGEPPKVPRPRLATYLDLLPAFAAAKVDTRGPPVDLGRTVTVTFPDGRTGTVPLPPLQPGLFFMAIIENAATSGGLRFGDEPADPAPRDSLLYAGRVIGRHGTWAELDFIAVGTWKPAVKKSKTMCSGNQPLELAPLEVVIYDRRKGTEVGRREFHPTKEECPELWWEPARAPVPDSEVDAWLANWLKSPR